MQLSMKCSVAVHCLLFIEQAPDGVKVTGSLLAQSTGCNPVVIRKILSALKKAGLIDIPRGTGGARLCRTPEEITLYQIYCALEPNEFAAPIAIHPCDDRPCPVARNIRGVLQAPYRQIGDAVIQTMQGITLRSMLDELEQRIRSPKSQPAGGGTP